jgi:hypothetical protein
MMVVICVLTYEFLMLNLMQLIDCARTDEMNSLSIYYL